MEKVEKITTEYDLGVCKPDIALLDSGGKVVIVIEIIVTHKPESQVLQYYDKNKIACLQIQVKNFQDSEQIQAKLSQPYIDSVSLCPNTDRNIQSKYQLQSQHEIRPPMLVADVLV